MVRTPSRCTVAGYGRPLPSTVYTLNLNSPADAWHEMLITAGTPPSPRMGHGQVIVEIDGCAYLYVFGGRQPSDADAPYDGTEEIASLNDMHRLSLSTGTWEALLCTGDVPSVRSYCALTFSLDSTTNHATIYLFGGMIDNTRHADLHAFHPLSNKWVLLPHGPMEGRGGAGLCAAKGSLWVVAGFVFLHLSYLFFCCCCFLRR
jgi:N-acetylneuraminic acid mutarotase